MTLFIRPAAQADLIEIGDYIAIDNPDRALSFFAEFEALIFSAIAARHHRYLAFFTHNENASKCCASCTVRVTFSSF